jgi:predicted phage tail protein
MMQRVVLLDELGEKFGSVHEYYNLRTPADAIRLLMINYPEFGKDLAESGEKGIAYKVVQSETEFELEDMLLPFGSKDLIITPVITGSGDNPLVKVIVGVALIGLAVYTLGAGSFALTGFSATGLTAFGSSAAAAAIAVGGNIGIALTLGGIAQMLSPQPDEMSMLKTGSSVMDNGPQSLVRGSDGRQSYAYRGAVNSVGAGATIPVVFGKALIGSHIVHADMEITDESDPLTDWVKQPSPDTMRIQGERLEASWKDTSGMKSRTVSPQDISSFGGVSYLSSPETVDLTDKSEQRIGSGNFRAEFSGNTNVNRFQIAFRLNNGLYKEIGEAGSTKVDGFIRLKIITERDSGARVTEVPLTIQGLMTGSQSYSWVHWFTVGKIPLKDWYRLFIEPVDYSADLNVNTLEVLNFGYYLIR